MPTGRTRRTFKRFQRRLAVVVLCGLSLWPIGLPVLPGMALLCHAASLVSALRAFAVRERLRPTRLGHLDEAAWFFLVGHVLLVLSNR